jgi:NitT/TauT family transport system substrate-binding protein
LAEVVSRINLFGPMFSIGPANWGACYRFAVLPGARRVRPGEKTMHKTALKITTAGAALFGWMVLSAFAPPAKKIELGLQATGTAAWEIAAMQEAKIDEEHGIDVEIRDVANSGAGQVALQAHEVDVILSDFVWTSIQRHEGADFTFVPHSLAVGALMVMPDGPIQSIEDLDGASIAVAGGPVDKSYVALQAYYAAKTGGSLPDVIEAEFGAPPLVNELLLSGQVDAALNFWHFNARAMVDGAVELISVSDMLKELGVTRTPPLLGWVFSERWARSHKDEIGRFLEASFETKQLLLEDDELWNSIRPAMGDDISDEVFIALRDSYRRGIVTSYGQEDIDAAAQSFALMAQYGGVDLVGDVTAIAEGTFWDGFRVGG